MHLYIVVFNTVITYMPARSEFLHEIPADQCLDVIELTRKYQMDSLETNLQRHLRSLLPSSTADILVPNWNGFLCYHYNPPLARNVLRFGAKELWPWAFYYMGTRMIPDVKIDAGDKSAYDPPPTFLSLDVTFTYELLALLQLIRSALRKWDKQIGQFYSIRCSQASNTSNCSRYARIFDNSSPLYLSPDENIKRVFIVGPMVWGIRKLTRLMEQDKTDHGRWCTNCKNSLKKIATNIFLEFYQGLVECTNRLDRSRL